MKSKLLKLNKEQKKQVLMQWKKHQHKNHTVTIEMSGHGDPIKGFIVNKGVWNPTIVSAKYHASYLYYNNARLFKDKMVLDVGTGTGLMGVVMGLMGAKQIFLTDISITAVKNAKENVEKFGLKNKATVVQGDLFENVKGKFDFITFMLPYFADTPPEGDTIAASMLNPGDLLKRFLQEVPKYLNRGGSIMIPFYSKAGKTNDPVIQGSRYGFDVNTTFRTNANSGLQKGEITVHELRLKEN